MFMLTKYYTSVHQLYILDIRIRSLAGHYTIPLTMTTPFVCGDILVYLFCNGIEIYVYSIGINRVLGLTMFRLSSLCLGGGSTIFIINCACMHI